MTFRTRAQASVHLALYHAASALERTSAGDLSGSALHASAAAKYAAHAAAVGAMIKAIPRLADHPTGLDLADHERETLALFHEAMSDDDHASAPN